MRKVIVCGKWILFFLFIFLVILVVLGIGGIQVPMLHAEITHQKPFADFIGREYRVKGSLTAFAWNDFPNKDKILAVSLMPPPGVKNRFVSFTKSLPLGQRIRIVSAWRYIALFEIIRYYEVSVPGLELPEGVPIKLNVKSDGIPVPGVLELMPQ